jgi:hypothetical protein
MTNTTWLAALGTLFLLATPGAESAQPARPEATSLLGKPLFPAPIAAETRQTLEENLKNAEIVYGRNPDDADATIWIGRRVAYLGRYREAIEHFSDGVEKHPEEARMCVAAEADLARAAK